ncbi:MFS transporter [Streptomyces sp. NPDC050610]|uniref:MFS transporter n=1 Tax=Streptomyces sp. NPDC050610 TaxID=3157097 RepID=UPI003414D29D
MFAAKTAFAAPRSGPGPAARPSMPLPPLIALSLGYFMVMLDVTVVTVAVPGIRTSLHAGAAGLQWIVDGYSAVFAALLLLGGGLGDRLGHRKVFLAGLGAFTLASIGCGLAPTTGALIATRLLQGVGAAFLVPSSLALVGDTYPERAVRARAFGIWATVSGVGFASGPVLGGLMLAGLDWRAVFWLNLPVGALAVLLTLRYVPGPAPRGRSGPASATPPSRRVDSASATAPSGPGGPASAAAPRAVRGRFDPVGQSLAVLGLAALAAALNEASGAGWGSPLVLGAFGVAALALGAFVAVERRLEAALIPRRGHLASASRPPRLPLLPPSLFRRSGIAATAVIGVLLNLGFFGLLYLATLYFQRERGYGPLATGLAILPAAAMVLVSAPLSGRLTARFGPYRPMAWGLLLGAVGFLGWLAAGTGTSYAWLLLPLVVTGFGVPMTVPAATAAIMESAPADGAGMASAVFNVARQVGNAIGVALFGTLAATGGSLVAGVHLSAVIASGAFALGALLAWRTGRRADEPLEYPQLRPRVRARPRTPKRPPPPPQAP